MYFIKMWPLTKAGDVEGGVPLFRGGVDDGAPLQELLHDLQVALLRS